MARRDGTIESALGVEAACAAQSLGEAVMNVGSETVVKARVIMIIDQVSHILLHLADTRGPEDLRYR